MHRENFFLYICHKIFRDYQYVSIVTHKINFYILIYVYVYIHLAFIIYQRIRFNNVKIVPTYISCSCAYYFFFLTFSCVPAH